MFRDPGSIDPDTGSGTGADRRGSALDRDPDRALLILARNYSNLPFPFFQLTVLPNRTHWSTQWLPFSISAWEESAERGKSAKPE